MKYCQKIDAGFGKVDRVEKCCWEKIRRGLEKSASSQMLRYDCFDES